MAFRFRGIVIGVSIALTALVATAGGVAYAATRAHTSTAPTVASSAAARPTSSTVAVAIGDSIMAGHGLDGDEAWPALVAANNDWSFVNLASDGSGFEHVGANGDVFQEQAEAAVALAPNIIFLAGSSNDLGESNTSLDEATAATISYLRAKLPNTTIVAVDAIWGASALPEQMNAIDGQVKSAISAVGGYYLDIGQPMSGQVSLMQSGDVHPTAAGHRVIAAAVESAMRTAKVPVA